MEPPQGSAVASYVFPPYDFQHPNTRVGGCPWEDLLVNSQLVLSVVSLALFWEELSGLVLCLLLAPSAAATLACLCLISAPQSRLASKCKQAGISLPADRLLGGRACAFT